MKKLFFLITILLVSTFTSAYAKTNDPECPAMNRITVLTDMGMPIIWVAPLLDSSKRYGIGLGGDKVAPLIKGFTTIDGDWICIYASSTHSTFSNFNNSKLPSEVRNKLKNHYAEIMKNLPDNFNYGFLLYDKK